MSFSQLHEQKTVADQLRRSLKRGRIAHAYLLAGSRGSGKERVAQMLAKALNCPEKEHDSCDRCDSCRRIDEGTHPDVYWVRPESKSRRIIISQIRELERAVNLKPTMARVKVGIIVDADCMGEEASNAFLKTLEEPPAQTVILLLSAQPQRLLPTIRSRCLKISFDTVTVPTEHPYCEKVLPMLAQFCERSEQKVVRAYQLFLELNALLAQIHEKTRARVEEEANLDRYEEIDAETRERLEDEMEARIKGEYWAAREQVLEGLYSWFGDVLLCVEGADERLLTHPDQLAALRRAASALTYAQAAANLEAVEQIRESLARNISESLALEVGLLKVA